MRCATRSATSAAEPVSIRTVRPDELPRVHALELEYGETIERIQARDRQQSTLFVVATCGAPS
jgi:hypothetical protein